MRTDWWRLGTWSIAAVLFGVNVNFWFGSTYLGSMTTLLLIAIVDCFSCPVCNRYPERNW